jgi:hypothetical protein
MLVSFLILPRFSLENLDEKSFGETNTVIVTFFNGRQQSKKLDLSKITLALAIVNMTK